MDDSDLYIGRRAAILRHHVEEKIRTAIATGRFRPGESLTERLLCSVLGAGRTSIREALRLEAEGSVTTIPQRGPVVSQISVEEAQQLYAVQPLSKVMPHGRQPCFGIKERRVLRAALKVLGERTRAGREEKVT
jgi:DNA-binding GntR family transcriptional regulator